MGFSISWVAFRGLSTLEVLRRTRLRSLKTTVGLGDEGTHRLPLSLAEIPTGWTIVFANDFEYGSNNRLGSLSAGTTVVACQAEEHVMFSAVHCYTDSLEAWSVCHDGQRGLYDLSTRGVPPAALEPIKTRLSAEQSRRGGFMLKDASDTKAGQYSQELLKGFGNSVQLHGFGSVGNTGSGGSLWAATDYMFDVPVELAAELTGFRHDRGNFQWGQPHFTKLKQMK